ncbi:hypothetical protein [Effusibacillus dendaii]|uniref:Uncharacterized protein n=1 Tax=Effusibacillus dendaii TaxID=2743772 RepID=A0A7I8DEU0_9BACL|nr:hypothetical protein [Effusibacillus dendaii]BCJ87070.1 hypothetical protein skT53_20550 [Effusibacillus dendaii]
MSTDRKIGVLLWSIALPGFGQLRNGKYVKGIVFIILEFIINWKANLNQIILESFHGEIESAIALADYQWLLFYPCVYMFAIWDAYSDAGPPHSPFSYLPFVLAAYIGTLGVIYAPTLKILGVLWGPVWLPLFFLFVGVVIGLVFRKLLLKRQMSHL